MALMFPCLQRQEGFGRRLVARGGGSQSGQSGSERATRGLTSAEWVEIAVFLHLRDGEIVGVGCDYWVLAIGAGEDGLKGPDSVNIRDEGELEALGPLGG